MLVYPQILSFPPFVGDEQAWIRPWVREETVGGGIRHAPVPYAVLQAMIPCPHLEPQDRKLLIALLARVWNDLDPCVSSIPEPWTLAQELRQAIGSGTSKNNSLRASLQRLVSVPVLCDPESDTVPCHPLLAEYEITRGPDGNEITWAFTTALGAECLYPRRWHYLDLNSCAAFKCKYSLPLYALLSGLTDRRNRIQTISIGDLRTWLGVEATYGDWYALRTWVLERAVAEINKVSDIRVAFEGMSRRYGRTIRQVRFEAKPTPERSAALHRGGREGSKDKSFHQRCARAA